MREKRGSERERRELVKEREEKKQSERKEKRKRRNYISKLVEKFFNQLIIEFFVGEERTVPATDDFVIKIRIF